MVLESDGFNDLLVRADYLSRIGEQDSVIVDRVRELKQESARKRALLLDAQGAGAEAAVDVIAAQQHELAGARAGIQAREADARRGARRRSAAARHVREHRHELEGDLRGARGRLGTGHGAAQGGGPAPAGPIRQGSGGFIWPVNGPVVSPFGMRWGRLHAGIDIAVPAGTPIRAAPAAPSRSPAGWAATATTPASSTAAGSPPATRTSRRSA